MCNHSHYEWNWSTLAAALPIARRRLIVHQELKKGDQIENILLLKNRRLGS